MGKCRPQSRLVRQETSQTPLLKHIKEFGHQAGNSGQPLKVFSCCCFFFNWRAVVQPKFGGWVGGGPGRRWASSWTAATFWEVKVAALPNPGLHQDGSPVSLSVTHTSHAHLPASFLSPLELPSSCCPSKCPLYHGSTSSSIKIALVTSASRKLCCGLSGHFFLFPLS